MSDFPGLVLTRHGQLLLTKLQAGGLLTFTRVATGSGRMPPDNNVFFAAADGAAVIVSNTEAGAAAATDVDTGFNVEIVTPGGTVPQVATVQCLAASNLMGGEHFTISSPYLAFHVWFTVGGMGSDPAPPGSIPIRVDLETGDTDIAVAAALATALDAHLLALADLCALITERQELAIQSVARLSDTVSEISVVLTNTGLAAGYDLREIGIFATDPDLGEILYMVTNAGEQGDYFPAEGGAILIEADLRLRTLVSEAAEVQIVVTAQAYASLWQFVEHKQDPEAHADIRVIVNRPRQYFFGQL